MTARRQTARAHEAVTPFRPHQTAVPVSKITPPASEKSPAPTVPAAPTTPAAPATPAAPGASAPSPAAGPGDAELLRWVEACTGVRAHTFRRRLLHESTSFACEFLTLTAGGRTQRLFFKDYDRCRLPREDAAGIRREIEVYRNLLDPLRLGTPRSLGSLCAPEHAHTWLLLEHAPGTRLGKHDARALASAAAWLGALQAHWASRRGTGTPWRAASDVLLVHDRAAYRATADAARAEVAAIDPALERRLREALDGHEDLVAVLDDQPRTLVHGSFRPQNILVDAESAPLRVTPVDWEHAALGSALYDLAFLTADRGRKKVEKLCRAQAAAAIEHGLEPTEADEAWGIVLILRLHKLLRSLTRARTWGYPRETTEHLVTLVGQQRVEACTEQEHRRHARTGATDLLPAQRAWASLGRQEALTGVERLRGTCAGSKGRVVFRLSGKGRAVVAKRSLRATLAVERHVYEHLLPRLGVPAPRLLGWVPDGEENWLFIEDAGRTPLDPDDGAQRACALRWLAQLHTASLDLPRDPDLPERGIPRFREILDEARSWILSNLDNPSLMPSGRRQLDVVLEGLARLAAHWEHIAVLGARMPTTLVHGDFHPKNLFPRRERGTLVLQPIDWEYAGRGLPALDLGALLCDRVTRADRRAYREALGPRARRPSGREFETWVAVGRVLRTLDAIHWICPSLAHPNLHKPVSSLGLYATELGRALDEVLTR
ncbi:MAG: phosphotransferase [Planctomycetota bacterium]